MSLDEDYKPLVLHSMPPLVGLVEWKQGDREGKCDGSLLWLLVAAVGYTEDLHWRKIGKSEP